MAHHRFDGIIGYFDPTVLAAYRAEPDKYSLQTDFFEGRIGITTPYYESLPEAERDEAYIEVQFGFRTLANGALALAAYLPDLPDKSEGHVNRWKGFLVRDPSWSDYEQDERFKNWVRRYLEGIGTWTTDRLITSLRRSSSLTV